MRQNKMGKSVVVVTCLLRWLQRSDWAYQVIIKWGELADGQHPWVTIANQLISLTEVSCLQHNAHRESQLADYTAKNCCCNNCACECVFVRVHLCNNVRIHGCLFASKPLHVTRALQQQVCVCLSARLCLHNSLKPIPKTEIIHIHTLQTWSLSAVVLYHQLWITGQI